jgi:hypothetical protein
MLQSLFLFLSKKHFIILNVHKNEFLLLIEDLSHPHIICATETWFNNNSIINIRDYTIYYKNREFSRGGGVAIWIRNYIDSFETSEKKLANGYSIEQIWCEIKSGSEKL